MCITFCRGEKSPQHTHPWVHSCHVGTPRDSPAVSDAPSHQTKMFPPSAGDLTGSQRSAVPGVMFLQPGSAPSAPRGTAEGPCPTTARCHRSPRNPGRSTATSSSGGRCTEQWGGEGQEQGKVFAGQGRASGVTQPSPAQQVPGREHGNRAALQPLAHTYMLMHAHHPSPHCFSPHAHPALRPSSLPTHLQGPHFHGRARHGARHGAAALRQLRRQDLPHRGVLLELQPVGVLHRPVGLAQVHVDVLH